MTPHDEQVLVMRITHLEVALREALEIATRTHYECEDCFYSCSTICCDDNRRDKECDCGADDKNRRISEIRKQFLEG